MSKKLFLSLFTLVFLLKAATALTVDVPAKGNECFYEELEQGEKLTLTYQVNISIKAYSSLFLFYLWD